METASCKVHFSEVGDCEGDLLRDKHEGLREMPLDSSGGQAATGGWEEAQLLAVSGGAGVQSMRPRVTVKFAHLEKIWGLPWWRNG